MGNPVYADWAAATHVDRARAATQRSARAAVAWNARIPFGTASLLLLQRTAGNAAVGALVQRQSGVGVGRPVSVQRDDVAEEPAGCGFCIDPGPAGVQAHNQVQNRMGRLGVDSEVKVIAGRGGGINGRLDLARWDETSIEIGEIKPDHASGIAAGHADLKHYKSVLEKTKHPTFKGKTVRMLEAPAPAPMVFDNPGVALPVPQMMETRNEGGVYGYKCRPPNADYFSTGGALKAGDKNVTPEMLQKKKDFFDSECIRKKTKRRPAKEERVKILDRAGVVRLVKPATAMALLQSRTFHVKRELEMLSGEHHERHRIASRSTVKGFLRGGVTGAAYSSAALYDLATMPSLGIWTAAHAAANKCEAAQDLRTLTAALDEFDRAMQAPRAEFLRYKGVTQAHTPAPAAGASPPAGKAPPLPPTPRASPAAPPGTTPAQTEAGMDPVKIAALAAVVILTFLILQPEIGAAAVAGAATGGAEAVGAAGALGAGGAEAVGAAGALGAGGAEVLGAGAAGGEVLTGGAASATQALLETTCEVATSEPLLGTAAI